MSNNLMFNVGSDFDLDSFAGNFLNIYHARGLVEKYQQIKGGHIIDINQGNEGFYKYIGLGANIRLSLVLIDDVLHINLSDADWTGKIVAYIISPFLCGIPTITCIMGIVKQLNLPAKIKDDLLNQLSSNQQATPNSFKSEVNASPAAPTGQQPDNACSNCGAGLYGDSLFCTNCGAKV